MKKIILASCLTFICSAGLATSSPTSVFITVYNIGFSTNTDCSNPTIVANYGTTGKEFDFVQTPNLGGGNLPNGTYPCMIMQMSDNIKFIAGSNDGSCVAGTKYTIDVCRSDNSCLYTALNVSGSTATYGGTTSGTGVAGSPSADIVTLFLSTTSTGSGGGQGFLQPTGATSANGFNVANPFIVSGSKSGTFVANFNNKMNGSGTYCDVNPPIFGFR